MLHFALCLGYEGDILEGISNLHVQGAKFESFIGYEGDIISNLQVQGAKLGRKIDKFGGKSFLKLNFAEFMKFFSSSLSLVIGSLRPLVSHTEQDQGDLCRSPEV